jgi:transcriptional regulator with GAF, ATPase, and Fis domain
MDTRDEDLRRFRGCVRDLTALSALPLVWVGSATPEVVGGVLDTLVGSLRLDLAYARITESPGGPAIEAARAHARPEVAQRGEEIGRALGPMLGSAAVAMVPNPVESGTLRIRVLPLGLGEQGAVVAGSHRVDFPTDFDTALLGAAVNQLTIWLRATRLLLERGRAEKALANSERERRELEEHNVYLREQVEHALAHNGIVGRSPALQGVLAQIELVAPTEATVLILGESGTGKELVAREIHSRSGRAGRPLIKVNCSAIPRDMFESEFFGHVRGAFTSAVRDRHGRFQLADGGTIFLDEVGDLPLDLQPKLLRVLQEGQYERVGDDVTREVDVRVIAATNRDLAAEVRAGRFRQDLYYRLSVFPIRVPPLRERKEDIPLLAAHFVTLATRKPGTADLRIGKPEWEELKAYDWPGNIRELANLMERAVILSRGGRLQFDLPVPRQPPANTPPSVIPAALPAPKEEQRAMSVTLEDAEREHILRTLQETSWLIGGATGAASRLGMPRTTLIYKMQKLGIPRRPQ